MSLVTSSNSFSYLNNTKVPILTTAGVSKAFTWCRYRLRRLCRLSTCEDATSSWRITLITEPIKNKWRERKRNRITDGYLWKYKEVVSQQMSNSFLLRFLKVFSEVWRQNGLENKIIGETEQSQWWSPLEYSNREWSNSKALISNEPPHQWS